MNTTSAISGIDQATKQMVRKWIDMHRGDTEAVARYMSQTLRIGGLKSCRQLVEAAQ